VIEGGWITVRGDDLVAEAIFQKCNKCPDVGDCLLEAVEKFIIFKTIVERSEKWRN